MSHIATSRPPTPDTIYDVLRRSPVARVLAGMELGEGCAVTVWENTRDRVCYQTPAHTTFSLHLQGGTGTRRVDAGGITGYPGAICVMPEGCGSDWEINAPFRFVHLYLSEARLRSGFVSTHDCDARSLDLPEATFVRNPDLAIPLARLAAAGADGDVLHAETALAELFGTLRRKPVTIRAGLAPHILRRVDDWIDAHLDQAITLDDLAALPTCRASTSTACSTCPAASPPMPGSPGNASPGPASCFEPTNPSPASPPPAAFQARAI